MSLIDSITARLPFGKKPAQAEHFFALNIATDKLKAALWTVEGNKLRVLNPTSAEYSGPEEIVSVTDRLLDLSLGEIATEPEKILFGVPDSWLLDDNLKEPYLKLLRNLVRSLEIKPMAYVSTSHALSHFLEKQEGAPTTTILIGVEKTNVVVTVVRAGKTDGTKIVKRSDSIGEEIEKALLLFTEVEVLPSRILLYSSDGNLEKHKSDLLSYPWMSKLSFLHFPKIDTLEKDVEIKAVALAGAVEVFGDVKYTPMIEPAATTRMSKPLTMEDEGTESPSKKEMEPDFAKASSGEEGSDFIAGDVMEIEHPGEKAADEEALPAEEETAPGHEVEKEQTAVPDEYPPPNQAVMRARHQQMQQELDETFTQVPATSSRLPSIPGLDIFFGRTRLLIPLVIILGLVLAYLFLSSAKVTIFVEPKVLEKDAQVTADPNIKTVDEAAKKIPGQIIEVQVNGSDKAQATGKKQVGDPAKGNVVIYNATAQPISIKSDTILVIDSGERFKLNNTVQIASKSASAASPPTKSESVGAAAEKIGPDGNIPSEIELKVDNFSKSEVVAKSEGNFSGGTSKEVTIVTDTDQKKLLASLAGSLRKQGQEQLQSKLSGKKVLEEGLSEEIVKKTFNKNVGDQAVEFNLNLIVKYKGTAYSENDLKMIVSKLVETNVPSGFELDLAETETQADVSKIEKDGRLIFLARFKAKLSPKLDQAQIRKQIRGQTPEQTATILKSYENVLGSEIKITPSLPAKLARLPLWDRNIKIEVSVK